MQPQRHRLPTSPKKRKQLQLMQTMVCNLATSRVDCLTLAHEFIEDQTDLIKSTFDVAVCASVELSLVPLISVTLQVTLADQQAAPNSPLYSIKTFEQLGL